MVAPADKKPKPKPVLPPEKIRTLLKQVMDPEIPVIDIDELGVLRDVRYEEDTVVVDITPTYSGCPAMQAIRSDIEEVLKDNGIASFRIRTVLSPAWTTDWMTDATRKKFRDYGIAPPTEKVPDPFVRMSAGAAKPVACPFCRSRDTKLTSVFGSTACKALHYCNGCRQPFEEFKCH